MLSGGPKWPIVRGVPRESGQPWRSVLLRATARTPPAVQVSKSRQLNAHHRLFFFERQRGPHRLFRSRQDCSGKWPIVVVCSSSSGSEDPTGCSGLVNHNTPSWLSVLLRAAARTPPAVRILSTTIPHFLPASRTSHDDHHPSCDDDHHLLPWLPVLLTTGVFELHVVMIWKKDNMSLNSERTWAARGGSTQSPQL